MPRGPRRLARDSAWNRNPALLPGGPGFSGSDLDPLAFEFELRPWTRKCKQCGETFRVVDYRPACAACGSSDTEAAGGDEIELSYLEVEEP